MPRKWCTQPSVFSIFATPFFTVESILEIATLLQVGSEWLGAKLPRTGTCMIYKEKPSVQSATARTTNVASQTPKLGQCWAVAALAETWTISLSVCLFVDSMTSNSQPKVVGVLCMFCPWEKWQCVRGMRRSGTMQIPLSSQRTRRLLHWSLHSLPNW